MQILSAPPGADGTPGGGKQKPRITIRPFWGSFLFAGYLLLQSVICFSFPCPLDIKYHEGIEVAAVDLRPHIVKTLLASAVHPRVLVVYEIAAKTRPFHAMRRFARQKVKTRLLVQR